MRAVVIIGLIFALTAIAAAQIMSGPMIPGGGGPMVPPGASGGTPPPPTCSNAMDFSQACNSQYIGAL